MGWKPGPARAAAVNLHAPLPVGLKGDDTALRLKFHVPVPRVNARSHHDAVVVHKKKKKKKRHGFAIEVPRSRPPCKRPEPPRRGRGSQKKKKKKRHGFAIEVPRSRPPC